MEVKILYSTPQYPKLVEYCARNCYDSLDKCTPESHSLVRGILAKGHLSVAQHGNILFGVSVTQSEVPEVMSALVSMKERNNFIRWSTNYLDKYAFLVSMNIITFIESVIPEVPYHNLALGMYHAVSEVEELRYFFESDAKVPPSDNPYLGKSAKLLNPSIISSDYAAMKKLGLTDRELDIHATVTVEVVTDRAMSLQDVRHKDMAARSEISQRYVTFDNFEYRVPNGVDADKELWVPCLKQHLSYSDLMEVLRDFYRAMYKFQSEEAGVSKLRAKEQARSILPNATLTRYIDTRPLRQWKHFFDLRVDVHAQSEKQDDAKALLKVMEAEGISIR